LVLINPPYAEPRPIGETPLQVGDAENKSGVANTVCCNSYGRNYGRASNELFTQFVARIAHEMPTATLAMFSTLKYVNAPTLRYSAKSGVQVSGWLCCAQPSI
jgi:hypothetical protein